MVAGSRRREEVSRVVGCVGRGVLVGLQGFLEERRLQGLMNGRGWQGFLSGGRLRG
jgi:hypothetical protein